MSHTAEGLRFAFDEGLLSLLTSIVAARRERKMLLWLGIRPFSNTVDDRDDREP
jgi:hypothetical protein